MSETPHRIPPDQLAEIETVIKADLRTRRAEETMKDKIESVIYVACLVAGATLLLIHLLTDWIPFLVGLPSARVIVTQMLNR